MFFFALPLAWTLAVKFRSEALSADFPPFHEGYV